MMIAKQKQICDFEFDIGASTIYNFMYYSKNRQKFWPLCAINYIICTLLVVKTNVILFLVEFYCPNFSG